MAVVHVRVVVAQHLTVAGGRRNREGERRVHRIEVLSDDREFDGTRSTEGTHSGRKRPRQRTSSAASAPLLHGVLPSPHGECIEIMSHDERESDEGKSDEESAGRRPAPQPARIDPVLSRPAGRPSPSVLILDSSTSTPPTAGRSSLTFTQRGCCAAYFSPLPPFSLRPDLRPKAKATGSLLEQSPVSIYNHWGLFEVELSVLVGHQKQSCRCWLDIP